MVNVNIQAVVLAAGKSTRVNTGRSKLAEPICGVPLIVHTITPLIKMDLPIAMVVSAHKELVRELVTKHHPNACITFVDQGEPLGTGHALWCTQQLWQKDHVLVVNGDCPLVPLELIQKLVDEHLKNDAAMSLVAAECADLHHAYGRVITEGNLVRVIEAKDFTLDPHAHTFINAGIYLFKRTFLQNGIAQLPRNEKTGEFYLPELTQVAGQQGSVVALVETDFDSIRGVNTLKELWVAEQLCRSRLIDHWMKNGVRFLAAQNTHVDEHVTIGQGTVIGNGVQLCGATTIGQNCTIDAATTLENVSIGDKTHVASNCVIKDSYIASGCLIGPFAHVHNQSVINAGSRVGSFVEVSNGMVGCQCTVNHHEYVEQPTSDTPVLPQPSSVRLDHA